jgi:hypothetical protein
MLSHLAENFITPYTDVLVSLPTMPRGTQDIVMRCLVQHLDTAKHLLTVAIQDQIERETAVSAKDWVLIDARAPQADAVLRRNILTQDLTSQVAEQYANFRVSGSKRSLEGIIPLDSSAMSIDKVHVCHTLHAKNPSICTWCNFSGHIEYDCRKKKAGEPRATQGDRNRAGAKPSMRALPAPSGPAISKPKDKTPADKIPADTSDGSDSPS